MQKIKKKIAIILLLLLIITTGQVGAKDSQQTGINLNFKEIDLKDAFRALADVADKNVITDSSVQGKVTVHLEEITFLAAVELLAKTNGLDYKVVNNTVLVAAPEKLRQGFGEKITDVFKLQNSEPQEVKKSLDSLIKEGLIKVDDRTKSLVVTAYQSQIPMIKRVIKQLDQAKRQVVLQARIEEMSRDRLEELGLNWDIGNFSSFKFSASDEETVEIGNTGIGVNYKKFLRLLEDRGHASVLANPQITTVTGKEARINIGDQVPIPQTNSDGETRVEFKDVGISLKITPRITSPNKVFIKVNPEVSIVSRYKELKTAKYPIISTRQAQTNVRVEDGQTIAIGGLIKEKELKNLSKVPFLGDLPILGKLFQSSSTEETKKELVIFITPKIIEDKAAKTNTKVQDNKQIVTYDYEVQAGDTLWNLSELFNLSFAELIKFNDFKTLPDLKPGQVIKIPVPKDHYYRVQAGDTIEQIVTEYDITRQQVIKMNNLEKLETITGLQLVLPTKVKPTDRVEDFDKNN
ncbi:LysM peptidoglycan-binding domain-containing protein [Halanaerobaculum tunisiense]